MDADAGFASRGQRSLLQDVQVAAVVSLEFGIIFYDLRGHATRTELELCQFVVCIDGVSGSIWSLHALQLS